MIRFVFLFITLLAPQGPYLPAPKADPRIVQFTPMVKKLARSYHRSRIALSFDLQDLEQEGFQALVLAIHKFDAARGMALESFAWHLINEAFIRTKVHCSRGMRSVATASLSAAGDDDEPWDFASPARSPEELADVALCAAELRRLLPVLLPREQQVLRLRYWEGETLEEIGTELGLTRERVRQIQDEGVERLKRTLRREWLIERSKKSTASQQVVIDESVSEVHLLDSGFVAPSPTSNREGAQSDG